jgi:hypothetical protein
MPPRWPNARWVTAVRSITSLSSTSATAWDWPSPASCCAARTGVAGEIAFLPLSGEADADEQGTQARDARGGRVGLRGGAGGDGLGGGASRQDDLRRHQRGRSGADHARWRDRPRARLRQGGHPGTRADCVRHVGHKVSALDMDAVVNGCLATGTDLAWGRVMTVLPTAPSGDCARSLS